MAPPSRVGDAIKARRRVLSIPRVELCSRAGIASQTLEGIERNKHQPRHATIVCIAHALDCTPEDLGYVRVLQPNWRDAA